MAPKLDHAGKGNDDPREQRGKSENAARAYGERPQVPNRRGVLRRLGNPVWLEREPMPHLDDLGRHKILRRWETAGTTVDRQAE